MTGHIAVPENELNAATRSARRTSVERPGTSGDAGVATVLACVCSMVLIVLTGLVLQLAAALLARHHAEVAADLGALAGAARILAGGDAACATASAVVAANAAAVRDCRADGPDLLLTVAVETRLGPLRASAVGRARAGPANGPR